MGRTPEQRIKTRIAFLQKQKNKYAKAKNVHLFVETEEKIEELKAELRRLET